MLQINSKLKNLFQGILKDYPKKEDLKISYEKLGETDNTDAIIVLEDKKIKDYDFLVVESGWGYYKAICSIPTYVFALRDSNYLQCKFQVPIYEGMSYVSLTYINETTFKINGAVGTDTQTKVFGAKIQFR